jgi:Sulfotransferase family
MGITSTTGKKTPLVDSIEPSAPLPCFVHINKNAGSTTRALLRANYGSLAEALVRGRLSESGTAITVDSMDDKVRTAVRTLRAASDSADCVAANLPYGLHRSLGRRLRYFALLRDPVERCISFWYFAHSLREHGGVWRTFEEFDFDVARIVESRAVLQITNDQLRLVTGSPKVEVGESELELAKELIASVYELVGTVDRYHDTVRALAQRFGWSCRAVEPLNIGNRSDPDVLPRSARSTFRNANELDIKLYTWVRQRYLPRALST